MSGTRGGGSFVSANGYFIWPALQEGQADEEEAKKRIDPNPRTFAGWENNIGCFEPEKLDSKPT